MCVCVCAQVRRWRLHVRASGVAARHAKARGPGGGARAREARLREDLAMATHRLCAVLRRDGEAPAEAPRESDLLSEIAAERMAVAAARSRCNAVRTEAREKRKAWAEQRMEDARAALTGRIRAELGLRRAQREQLDSLESEADQAREAPGPVGRACWACVLLGRRPELRVVFLVALVGAFSQNDFCHSAVARVFGPPMCRARTWTRLDA